ncbi:MAG: methyltransferase [Magnetococcales bacterium]|nr:methyltransferase [Magnetococcales bacterium]NGZ28718.1 methyltransferase [Magnetococcales bacterium]
MSYQKNARAVRFFAKVMKFSSWLQTIPNRLTPAPFRLIQIGSAFWQSRALYVATRLDLATVLGAESMDITRLAALVEANPDALGRLLRLLIAMGIFEEAAPGAFRNNKLSAFLRKDLPTNVRAMILMHNSEAMSVPWYGQLERGVREGIPPFFLAHGEELFPFLDHHADLDALFSEAMNNVEALTGDSFATDFDWSRFDRIIDVGGSRGAKSLAILKRYPHLTALVVDRPRVIADARHYWAAHGTDGVERLHFEVRDFLESVPPAQSEKDVYLLSAVLHGFDNDTCVTILGILAGACRTNGARIALLEIVLPEVHADLNGALFDMQMFMGSQGRLRTLSEWKSLFVRSGLMLEEVVGLQSFGNILVVCPAKTMAV